MSDFRVGRQPHQHGMAEAGDTGAGAVAGAEAEKEGRTGIGKQRLANRDWQTEIGKQRLANRDWQTEIGKRRLAAGAGLTGRAHRGVASESAFSSFAQCAAELLRWS